MRIHEAAATGDVEEVKRILDEFPGYVNVRDNNGETPLFVAVDHYQVDMVRFLLENGADPDARSKEGALQETTVPGGWTPLEWAAIKSSDQAKSGAIAELLIAAGADINDVGNDMGWPPVFVAIHEGNKVVERILREHGAQWDRDEASR